MTQSQSQQANNNQGKGGSAARSPGLMSAGGLGNAAANNTAFKKTGVCVSKCYQMLCGRCGRRFASKTSFAFQSYCCCNFDSYLEDYF